MRHMEESTLAQLREVVKKELSPYRAAHTLGVERAPREIAQWYAPGDMELLSAAALLHDITKEYSNEEQLALMARHGIVLRADEQASPQIWHAITAPLLICERFPSLSRPALLSAVRWHTTLRSGMTLGEAILYLADLVEDGRSFGDCVALREHFFAADFAAMPPAARLAHLRDTLKRSFDTTLQKLKKAGKTPVLDMPAAMEDLLHGAISRWSVSTEA